MTQPNAPSLVLGDLARSLGALKSRRATLAAQGLTEAQRLDLSIQVLEAEAVAAMTEWVGSISEPLRIAARARSRALLAAIPTAPDALIHLEEGDFRVLMSWAGPADWRLAAERGLVLSPGFEHLVDQARQDPRLEDVLVNVLAVRSVPRPGPVWSEKARSIFRIDAPRIFARLLRLHATRFPREMQITMDVALESGRPLLARALFVAGVRPGPEAKAHDREGQALLETMRSAHAGIALLGSTTLEEAISAFSAELCSF